MTDVYRFVEAGKTTFGVAFLCRLLKVARSSFYAWAEGEAARRRRQEADDALAHESTVLHAASKHTYGVPRIHAELAASDARSAASGWSASGESSASPAARAAGAEVSPGPRNGRCQPRT